MTEQPGAPHTLTRRLSQTHANSSGRAEGDGKRRGGRDGIHIYRAFLAFVPRPNAVTTLC